jgi:predicted RNase H-like nuclease
VSAILSLVKVHPEVTFCFYGFQSEELKKKLEVLFEKNLSIFEHSFYKRE